MDEKKSGLATKDLKTIEEVEKFQKDNDVILIYFSSDKDDIAVFIKIARKNEDFQFEAAQIIFGKSLPAIMLYASEKSEKLGEYEKLMISVSEKLKGKLKVVPTDIKEGMAARLAEYIGIKENELPPVRIADTRNDFKKYNMEGEINEKNILQFVEDWENNKLKPHLKTAEEPKDNNGDVFVVLRKTFERDVINNDKDIMLLF